jgi:GntR family transcriptional repressor for pyruvate dehydrogenase complex
MLIPVRKSGTLTEAIAGQLIQLIMNGRFKPGDKLPTEFELAGKFGAGRGAVREALKALAVIGLVRVMPGKGTYVNGRENFLIRPLSLGVQADTELLRLAEARKLLEVEVAGLAAERASADQIRSLEACLARMRESAKTGQSKAYLEADVEFHFAVSMAAGNFILTQFLTLIRNLVNQWISEALSLPGVAEESLRQHIRIFTAIRNRKPTSARKAMERHLSTMAGRFALAQKPKTEQALAEKSA